MLDEGASLGDLKGKLSIYLKVKSIEGNWRARGNPYIVMQGPLDLLTMEIKKAENARWQFSKFYINGSGNSLY